MRQSRLSKLAKDPLKSTCRRLVNGGNAQNVTSQLIEVAVSAGENTRLAALADDVG